MPDDLRDIKMPDRSFDDVAKDATKEVQGNYDKMKDTSFSDVVKDAMKEVQKNYGKLQNAKLPDFTEAVNKAVEEMKQNLDKIKDLDFTAQKTPEDFEKIASKLSDFGEVMGDFAGKFNELQKEYGINIKEIAEKNKELFEKLKNVPGFPFANLDDLGMEENIEQLKKEYEDNIDEILEQNKEQLEKLKNTPGLPYEDYKDMNSSVQLMDLLARTIYAEQTNIKNHAQEAVAWTIINRMKSNKELQAILKPGIYSSLSEEGGNNNALKPDVDSPAWQNALGLARKIYAEEYSSINNEIGSATEFRSKGFFESKLTTQTDKNGNTVYYFEGNKVKNIHYIGGNAFFEYAK